jgi:hypothetical protein
MNILRTIWLPSLTNLQNEIQTENERVEKWLVNQRKSRKKIYCKPKLVRRDKLVL